MNAKLFRFVFTSVLIVVPATTQAQMYINEIYFDPPGASGDIFSEYVEIRGNPNEPLDNHYLIFLDNSDNPGAINALFDLGSLSTPQLGPNGFLTLRQAGNLYGTNTTVNPAATNLVNTASTFNFGLGNTSSVGFRSFSGDGQLSNSGFTVLLIQTNGDPSTTPFIPSDPNDAIDLDVEDDNELDLDGILSAWTILDSIGVNPETGDEDGFLYAPINFGASTPVGGANVPAGAAYIDVDFDDIEYLGRWGNSVGNSDADWHASNLTNSDLAGYIGPDDYRQSAEPQGSSNSESSRGVATGTILSGTLGGPNIPEPSSFLLLASAMLLSTRHRGRDRQNL